MRVALIVLTTLLVATLGAGGWMWYELERAVDTEQSRTDALRMARQFTVNFTTIDHRSVGKDVERVQKLASGEFGKEYENAAESVKDVVKDNKTVSKGEVLEAGLVDFDGDDARALVVADAQLKNSKVKKGQQRHYRLQLDLARQGEKWRVIDVVFVQ